MEARRIRCLLVEDDDDHAVLMLRNLRRHGVWDHFDRVRDGIEALDFLRADPPFADRKLPDVILLDLNMPRMNGHELLGVGKEDSELRVIPIVVITTSDAKSDRTQAYQRHVNSYLVKPVDFEQYRGMADELSRYWGQLNMPSQ